MRLRQRELERRHASTPRRISPVAIELDTSLHGWQWSHGARLFLFGLMLEARISLYGPNSVPAQIAENKKPYYRALEAADEAHRKGEVNTGELEALLQTLLARQLWGCSKVLRPSPMYRLRQNSGLRLFTVHRTRAWANLRDNSG